MDYDYGELKNDTTFVAKVQSVSEAIAKIEAAIKESANMKIDELSTEDKIKYDIFLTYAINSLYFMYLKVDGENPNTVSHIRLNNIFANKIYF
jgi:exosome complex protein LRP1